MKQYLNLLDNVIEHGKMRGNRTGNPTKYLFSQNFRHDLREGFPLLTTKKINPKQILGELFGFLRGETTVEGFQALGCNIWNPWGLEDDYYKLTLLQRQDYAAKLAEALSITEEEAQKQIDEVAIKFNEWKAEYDEVINKITSGEIDTAGSIDATNAVLVKQPKTVEQFLKQNGVSNYIKDIKYPKGYLGPIYGHQWLHWKTSTGEEINQIARIANQLENHRSSRRIVLTAWNPEVVPADTYQTVGDKRPVRNSSDGIQAAILDGKQALPPCHLLVILDADFDPEVDAQPVLNLHMVMRSTDVPVGLPYNIASYAYLMEIIAKQYGMIAGVLSIDMTNCHVYSDQIELAKGQLLRTPKKLPRLVLPEGIEFDKPETLTVEKIDEIIAGMQGYEHDAFIKYPVAV